MRRGRGGGSGRECKYCGRSLLGTKFRKCCGRPECVNLQKEDRKAAMREVENERRLKEKELNAKSSPKFCEKCGKLFTVKDNRRLPVCNRKRCLDWWKIERKLRPARRMKALHERRKAEGWKRNRIDAAPVEHYCDLRPDDFTHQRYLEEQKELNKLNGRVCQWEGCNAGLRGNNRMYCKEHRERINRLSDTFRCDGAWGGGEDGASRTFNGIM